MDPTGATSNCGLADNDATKFAYWVLSFSWAPGKSTWSTWAQAIGPGTIAQVGLNTNASADALSSLVWPPVGNVAEPAFRRRSVSGTATAGIHPAAAVPRYDSGPETGTTLFWGIQAEAGSYPTSVIPTSGGAGSRDADVLSGAATMLVPNGYLDWTLELAPNFAQGEQAADEPLIWLDAKNQVYLRQSDGKIALLAGGVTVLASPALSFVREQTITLHLINSAMHGASLTVSGATTGNGTVTASATPMSTPTTVYVLGNNLGAQECADLQKITILAP
jgi:hypothetical protein